MNVEGNEKNRELRVVENVGCIDGKSIKRVEGEMPALGVKLLVEKEIDYTWYEEPSPGFFRLLE